MCAVCALGRYVKNLNCLKWIPLTLQRFSRKVRGTWRVATDARILDINDCFQNLECVGFSIITWPPYDIIKSMRSATLFMRAV